MQSGTNLVFGKKNERVDSVSKSIRIVVFGTIMAAVCSGFLKAVMGPDIQLDVGALNIFLFNLATGGTLILTRFAGKSSFTALTVAYYLGALVFAVAASIHLPAACIVSAIFLAVIVEYVRWTQFGWFPEFFQAVSVSRKFQQAALLCLSSGLFICAATMLNNSYLGLVHLEKLDLHVFFLGFSFPISLSTFSLLFERVEAGSGPPVRRQSEFCFWALNLGVIVFFLFIVSECYPGQILMSLTLFTTIMVALSLHLKYTPRNQEATLLTSALAFSIVGSLSGIAYVLLLWTSENYTPGIVLSMHAAAAVFGWNMVWLMLTARKGQYPLAFNTKVLLGIHWTLVVLIPFARESVVAAVPAALCLLVFLGMALFSSSKIRDAAQL